MIQIRLNHVGGKKKKTTTPILIKRTRSLLSHIANSLRAVRGTTEIAVINITRMRRRVLFTAALLKSQQWCYVTVICFAPLSPLLPIVKLVKLCTMLRANASIL